jgi:spoIIIJ-associated protein
MKKIEANSLEEAYDIACKEFGCSIRELKYEIIQYPQKGVFGLFAKKAIIVATQSYIEKPKDETHTPTTIEKEPELKVESQIQTTPKEIKPEPVKEQIQDNSLEKNSEIVDNFFGANEGNSNLRSEDLDSPNQLGLASQIEKELKNLLDMSCFDIDTVEVDVHNNIAYVFIDGKDAALLIGKEGYRYNALSYLLFNWLNKAYGLYLKLEIAEFISTQESMIRNYIKPVIEHVNINGWGKTRPLDGILVQIALEQLREEFPNKYVAIKKQKDGSRYIIINDFNKR